MIGISDVVSIARGGFGIVKLWREWTSKDRTPGKTPTLIFFPNQMHGCMWNLANRGSQLLTQVMIDLDVTNTSTAGATRLMSARLVGHSADSVLISVKDQHSGYSGHDYPLPPQQISEVRILLFLRGQPYALDEPVAATLIVVDHLAEEYRVEVILRAPKQ